MIHSIRANDPRFKTVTLHGGLNVVLADTTERSSSHDTRNGVGKTLLMEVLHFCLGGSSPRTGGLASPQLTGWAFTVELDLGEERCQVTRSLGMPQTVEVVGDFASWPVEPSWDPELSSFRLTNDEWKTVLGRELFDLVHGSDGVRFGPSFRLLFPYFARVKTGAYETPFKYFSAQREWQKQVAVASLLDLSWEHAARFQELKDQREALRNYKRGIEQGALGDTQLTLGRLRTNRVGIRKQIESLEAQLTWPDPLRSVRPV